MDAASPEKEKTFLEQFKLRRMIKKLESAEGDGTSLITLIIPAGKRVSDYSQMITEEIGKADNIKDRVNRQSVQTALGSVKEKLRNYLNKSLPTGLVLFCGNALLPGHKEARKMMIAFEPFKEINTKLYKCGDKFDVEFLKTLLETNERYGFIIVDGNGAYYGVLQGNNKSILSYFTVDLPKKHNKGGQSSNRFAHIRWERRLIYTKKVCEEAGKVFISDNRPNVEGLILAGYADFKSAVYDQGTFDPRLKAIVLKLVDISYGGEQGFIQAISLSQDCFKNVRLVQEQKMIGKFIEEMNFDTGRYCFAAESTIKCLMDNAVQTLIVWDNLDTQYVELKPKNPSDGTEVVVKYIKLSEIEYKSTWTDKQTGIEYFILDYDPLIDWFSENYQTYNTELFFISDKSPEGNQFVKGFSGIGGILRYKVDHGEYYEYNDDNDDNDFI